MEHRFSIKVPGESQMKKLMLLLLLVTPLIMTSSLHAVTYPFPKSNPAYPGNQSVMMAGTRLYLFHNSTQEVNDAINVNDILVVYRGYPHHLSLESTETGKVKVLSSLGENYYEAEVVEGTIIPGELARKGTAVCFITSAKNSH
jgi:hypothetical protein